MVCAAALTSRSWSPSLAWKRWRIQRARAKLTVMQGGQGGGVKKKRDDQNWLN